MKLLILLCSAVYFNLIIVPLLAQGEISCNPGEGVHNVHLKSGKCLNYIMTRNDCLVAYHNNKWYDAKIRETASNKAGEDCVDDPQYFNSCVEVLNKFQAYNTQPGCNWHTMSNPQIYELQPTFPENPTNCTSYHTCICQEKNCTKCPIGYYSGGGVDVPCTACGAGKWGNVYAATSEANACVSCSKGKYTDRIGQTKCKSCGVGYYTDSAGRNACISCPKGKYADEIGQTKCKSCGVGKGTIVDSAPTGCVDIATCNIGEGMDPTQVTNAAGCMNPITTEAECKEMQMADASKSYRSGNAADPNYCSLWNAAYQFTPPSVTTYVKCSSNEICICSLKTCSTCPLGTYSAGGVAALCKTCEVGHSCPDPKKNPIPCPIGTYQGSTGSSNNCTLCDTGMYNDEAGQTACKTCSKGKYNDEKGANKQSKCKTCSEGKSTFNEGSKGPTACVNMMCNVGYGVKLFYDVTDGCPSTDWITTYEECTTACLEKYTSYCSQENLHKPTTAGQKNVPRGCFLQDAQYGVYWFNPDTTSTASCQVPYSSSNPASIECVCKNNESPCSTCSKGYYSAGGFNAICAACKIGQYTDQTGQIQCKSCGENMYTTEEGQTSAASCKQCTPATNSPACSVCKKGQYGLKTCKNCAVGMFASLDHMIECKSCEAGTYATSVGAIECAKCEKGKASATPGESVKTACKNCLPGFYSLDGAATCKQCPSGKASTEIGTTSADACKDCTPGKYSNFSACLDCNSGYYSSKNAAFSSDTCIACPPERFYTPSGATLKSQCACPGGYFLSNDKCTACSVDYYCPGNNTIKPCQFGYNTRNTPGAVNESQCLLCAKNCIACPKNTYSVIGSGCQFCPENTPSTLGLLGATSLSQCKLCNSGSGFPNYGLSTGKCTSCSSNYKGIGYGPCIACEQNEMSSPGSSECFSPQEFKKQLMDSVNEISATQGGLIKAIALANAKSNEVKQKANGLIAKLSLDWATQDVINEAQKLRNQLSKTPEYNVKHHCEQEKQRLAYGVLRTGVVVPSDAEIDDKYCLNENRNRLISSFCNFRPRFIKLLQEKLYPRLPSNPKNTGRDLWPNICCKKDNFQNLKTCDDPSGKVLRSHIVPFALAQGGNLTIENLYGEIVDILKKDGYLQQGMNKAVDGIKDGDKLKAKLNNLFETTLLCGPREFGLPTNEAIRLCELFYPYEHMLATYYDEVNALLEPLQRRRRRRRLLGVWPSIRDGFTNLINSASGFMFSKDEDDNRDDDSGSEMQKLEDKMEMLTKSNAMLMNEVKQSRNKINRLEKKDAVSHKEIQHLKKKDTVLTNKTNTFLAILKQNEKTKRRLGGAAPLADELCPFVTMSHVSEYEKDIDTFCTGYAHIDLNHPGTVINLAIMTPWDIPPKLIPELREKARYEISDDCPTPMFTANDISLQNIDGMDLFVIQLDSTSPNGYLQKELPQCGATNNIALKPHIPKTTIDVKIWRDHEDCCKDTKDYNMCKAIKCLLSDDPNGIEPVNDAWTGLQVGYQYKVTGTTYTATCDNKPNSKPCGSNSRRRRLLQDEYGNSGERL